MVVVDVVDGSCQQLNAVHRLAGSKSDSGGQLNMCIGLSGSVQAFARPLPPGCLVLLATDGLTDNLPAEMAEADALIPLLLGCTFLDNPARGPGLDGKAVPGWQAVMSALRLAAARGELPEREEGEQKEQAEQEGAQEGEGEQQHGQEDWGSSCPELPRQPLPEVCPAAVFTVPTT